MFHFLPHPVLIAFIIIIIIVIIIIIIIHCYFNQNLGF